MPRCPAPLQTILVLLSVATLTAEARESKNSAAAKSDDAETSMSQENIRGLVINGKSFDVGGALKMPTTGQMRTHLCKRDSDQSPLCSNWPQVARSYETLSQQFGLPAPFLMCMTKQETRFGRNFNISPAGASGVNQFRSPSASDIAKLINKKYSSEFASYAMKTGCNVPVSSAHIRSTDYETYYCLSNFAMAVHMRRDLAAAEDVLESKLGSTSTPSQPTMEDALKFLIVSFNAGPANGLKFKDRNFGAGGGRKGRGGLARETKKYIDSVLNGCLKSASAVPES